MNCLVVTFGEVGEQCCEINVDVVFNGDKLVAYVKHKQFFIVAEDCVCGVVEHLAVCIKTALVN